MLQLLAVNQLVLGLTVVGFVAASVMMILIVLVQRPQGGGLSDAFGAGGGGGGTAFGAKTGDALTTGTIGVFLLFLALAISLNFMIRPGATNPQASVTAPIGAEQTAPASTATTPATGQPPTGQPVSATDVEGNDIGLQRVGDNEDLQRLLQEEADRVRAQREAAQGVAGTQGVTPPPAEPTEDPQ